MISDTRWYNDDVLPSYADTGAYCLSPIVVYAGSRIAECIAFHVDSRPRCMLVMLEKMVGPKAEPRMRRYTSGFATFLFSLAPVTSSSISCHDTGTSGFPASDVAATTPRCLSAVDKKYDRASPSDSYVCKRFRMYSMNDIIMIVLTTAALTVSPSLKLSAIFTLSFSVALTSDTRITPTKSADDIGVGRLLTSDMLSVACCGVSWLTTPVT